MDTVGNVSSSQYWGTTSAEPKQQLDMATFLNLLVTQLSNQNPLEPMNDSEFYAQIAQLGQVQGINKINETLATQSQAITDLKTALTDGVERQLSGLGAIYNNLSVSQAASMIGKQVTATIPATDSTPQQVITGTATRVNITSEGYVVRIEGADGAINDVKLSTISSIG